MIYCEDEVPELRFDHHLRNIPHVDGETDAARYLRAFDRMIAEAPPSSADEDWIAEAGREAIRFIADDAFRVGFESCHTNVVGPLRESSVSRDEADAAIRRYGERVRSGIAMLFEEAPGVPTQASVDIDELPLPPTKGILE
nr:hypothetical protein [uncultured Shinella sp.]